MARPTDRELLTALLFETILEKERILRRSPTPEEILDHLFSPDRIDPEARDLEKRLAPFIEQALENWSMMDEGAADV